MNSNLTRNFYTGDSVMNEDKKNIYYENLSKTLSTKNNTVMDMEKYNNLIQQVKDAKQGKKTINKHWLLKHYDVLTLDGNEHLVVPAVNSEILYYVPIEYTFDILFETHQSIGHGGRDKMRKELQRKYKNITYLEIQSFLDTCEVCLQKRRTDAKKNPVVKPMVSSHSNSKCQIDLIDFQSQSDGEYKFILVYQDHLTKFVILRALKSNSAEEISNEILDIFFIFGAPAILQSNKGHEFCSSIIENLKPMWPGMRIVHGKPSHNQSERVCQDVEDMLTTWMLDQLCNNWSKGLGYIQFMKNNAYHSRIKRCPFEAMFGQAPNAGLSSLNLHPDIISHVNTDEDIQLALADVERLPETSLDTELVKINDALMDGDEDSSINVCLKTNVEKTEPIKESSVSNISREEETYNLLKLISQRIITDDEFSVFGQVVVHKIRKFRTSKTRAMAQNRILNILFDLEMIEENIQS